LNPQGPLRGTLQVPGDKSITHRAILLSAIADGVSHLYGYLPSLDCLSTISAFRKMGVSISECHPPPRGQRGPALRIEGVGLHGLKEPTNVIDCGNSGTTLRLLCGLLAGQPFFSALTGDDSLRQRPMRRVVTPLCQMGAQMIGRQEGQYAPLAIRGGKLSGIHYRLPMASAQVKSAVLLAGLYADGITCVTESAVSRDHTERLFTTLGVPCKKTPEGITISRGASWAAREIAIPGDISSAAFFLVAATLVPNSEIYIEQVGVNPTRTGIVTLLQQMGADLTVSPMGFFGVEPVANLVVRASRLTGIHVTEEMMPAIIDEFPIFCVAAAMAEGETSIRGGTELRLKESDRIASMTAALRGLGVNVTELSDGIHIEGRGGKPFCGFRCKTAGDHRIAMSMAIAGRVAEGEVELDDPACIETSFPDFFARLASLS